MARLARSIQCCGAAQFGRDRGLENFLRLTFRRLRRAGTVSFSGGFRLEVSLKKTSDLRCRLSQEAQGAEAESY